MNTDGCVGVGSLFGDIRVYLCSSVVIPPSKR